MNEEPTKSERPSERVITWQETYTRPGYVILTQPRVLDL